MANSPRYLFVKAQIKGGALGDLFEARVPVASHTTKHGTFVPEHQTTVHKRHDDPKPAAPDPAARKHFYVSAIDGARKHLVAGPYASHDEAVGMVEHVRAHADKHDPRAHFMAWGTAGSDSPIKTPLGEGWKPPPAAEASSSTPAKPAKLKPAKPRGETVLGEPRAMHGDLILVPEESSTGAVGGGTKKTWRFGKVTGVNRAGYAMRHETPGIKVGGPMKKHEGHVHQSFIVQQEHMNGMSADDVLAKLPREYPGQHDWLKDYAHPDHAKADLLAAIGRHPLDAAA
jgi:hypothetical protein